MHMARATPLKRCSRCGVAKPRNRQHFHANGHTGHGDGLRADCAECYRAHRRELYHADPEFRARRMEIEQERKRRLSRLRTPKHHQARPEPKPDPTLFDALALPKTKAPRVGPYGRCEYDPAERRWRVSLTDEGRTLLEAHLKQWPSPVATARANKKLRKMLLAVLMTEDEDDVDAAIRMNWAEAMARYDPEYESPKRPGVKVQFSTFATFYTQRALNDLLRKRPPMAPLRIDQDNGDDAPALCAGKLADPRDHWAEFDDDDERREAARRLWARLWELPVNERKVLVGRFGLRGKELSLREAGEILGVSKERARQVQVMALARLRAGREVG